MKVAVEAVLAVFTVLLVITDTAPLRFLASGRRAHTRRSRTRR